MSTDQRRNRFHQRKRIFGARDAILELLRNGWPGRDIRTELGFEDVPESTFYHNLRALRRETALPSSTAFAERGVGNPAERDPAAPEKAQMQHPAKRQRSAVRITTLGKGKAERRPLDPDKWEKNG